MAKMTKAQILAICSLVCDLRGVLFNHITSPRKIARITIFALDIKKIIERESDQAELACQVLDLIVRFRREKPEEYREILAIFEEILDTHEKKRDSIRENLKQLF